MKLTTENLPPGIIAAGSKVDMIRVQAETNASNMSSIHKYSNGGEPAWCLVFDRTKYEAWKRKQQEPQEQEQAA